MGVTPDTGSPGLERHEDYFLGRFTAMASPCEVLVDTDDPATARAALEVARAEALRIEHKFSRYRNDNVVHAINHSGGRPIRVDEETTRLLDYAAACYELSAGGFDITSGVLRRVWTFDGREATPEPAAIAAMLEHVGWSRAEWRDGTLTLPAGMEIDLGGLGKEYAVDRAALGVAATTGTAFVVNFGGDLFARGPRRGDRAWSIGVEDPARVGATAGTRVTAPGTQPIALASGTRIELTRGAVATSGDARRYVTWQGRRLGHVLDPRTGWPVENGPRSVTVMAGTCIEAGSLATLAILRGPDAARFLEQQGVEFWLI
jgi:thiamine biosynthesis lipoprotein